MADENDLASAENDDLRSQLQSAFSKASEPVEPEATTLEPPVEDDDPIAKEAAAERARDEKGRFAKAAEEGAPEAPAAVPAEAVTQAQEAPTEAAQAVEAVRPPPGWSVAAKAVFDALPAPVREAVAKREAEVNAGFAKLADYKDLDSYAQMAKAGGTSLKAALDNYVGIEQTLQRNPIEGFARIAQNLGVHPVQMAQQILQAYGQPANQTAEGQQPAISPDVQALLQQQLAPLQRTVQELTQQRQRETQAQVDATINRFFQDPANKFAENLAQDMVPFINQRRSSNPAELYEDTLKWAYDKAAWANAETREVLINEQLRAKTASTAQKATQALAAAKSITGSPTPGASVSDQPAPDLRAELERQFAVASGRV